VRILLDTNAIIHIRQNWSGFRSATRKALADPENTVFVSSISAVELATKISLGKLAPLPQSLPETMELMDWTELPFTIAHSEQMYRLPWHHRDPFDRMLIAQALSEKLKIATTDSIFEQYGLEILR
jgi:PIN domain nuclease of toxin-antitoxin system